MSVPKSQLTHSEVSVLTMRPKYRKQQPNHANRKNQQLHTSELTR